MEDAIYADCSDQAPEEDAAKACGLLHYISLCFRAVRRPRANEETLVQTHRHHENHHRGTWTQHSGHWAHEIGLWALGSGHARALALSAPDSWRWILDTGLVALGSGHLTLDTRLWTTGLWNLDSGHQTLDMI
jgi:hypothetical protein